MNNLESESAFIFGSMRDSTSEENESVNNYIESISEPTGLNFHELLKPYEHKNNSESADEILERARKEREEKVSDYQNTKFNGHKILDKIKILIGIMIICLLMLFVASMIKELILSKDIMANLIGLLLVVIIGLNCYVNICRNKNML